MEHNWRFPRRIALLVAVSLLLLSQGFAQYRAALRGVVTDPSGAVVPGAQVTLKNNETNLTKKVVTTEEGVYTINQLPPGPYSLTIEKEGFKKKALENVRITADQIQGVDVTLDLGSSSESITVSADATPLINTENAQIGGTISGQDVQKLPSFGRDVFQLAQLAPGVFGDGSRNDGANTAGLPGNNGPGGSGGASGVFSTENRPQISGSGGRTSDNNVTLDGIGITSVSWGGAAIVTPNQDSVKEVRVVANSYDAENGRFSGAHIQVISQTGTNDYHGSLFFKADRPGLNAYQNWHGPEGINVDPRRNENRYNDWGGSIGGPIIKDKLFAFFSYERIANRSTQTHQAWFETPQYLSLAPAGSIAARYASYPGISPVGTIVPQTCESIGLNFEGRDNCRQVSGGLDIGSPLTTQLGTKDPSFVDDVDPGLGSGFDGIPDIMNIVAEGPNDQTNVQYNGRVDYYATSRDQLAFSIYRVPVTSVSYNGWREANLFHHNAVNEAETALWNHTFSPTLINELRVNAAGWRWNELDSNPDIPLGLPQLAFIGGRQPDGFIGDVKLTDNSLGGPAGSIFNQWTYSLKDVVTKVHSSHTIKFGGEVTKLNFLQDAPWSARPNFGFNNLWDFLNDAPVKEQGTFNPQTGVATDVRKDARSTLLGFFVQDDWKVRPNFTLNMGLRWEYFGPVSFKDGLLSTVVLGDGPNALTDMSMRIGGKLYNADKTNFGPQLGFAWSPSQFNSKLVLRGGFGMAYNGEQQAITLNGWTNIPFTRGNTELFGDDIVYAIPDDPNQFLPYPANPNTILTFGPNNIPTSGAPVSVTAYPADFATAYTYHYSMNAEYEMGRNWVASVGYQGSKARHLTRQISLNQVLGAQGIALNPMVSKVNQFVKDANSTFNALLLQARHRVSSTFQVDAQYRYAKSSDDGTDPYGTSYYQWDPKANRGPSDFDVAHMFKLFASYSPRIFSGSHGWLEKVAGGWTISGILNAHSSFPWTPLFNVGTCDVIYKGGNCQGGGQEQILPLAYLGGAGQDYSNDGFLRAGGNFPNGGTAYFTMPTIPTCTADFPAICSGPPQAPGVVRNSLRGPRYFSIDATLSKTFGLPKLPLLGESAKLEFRANAFNLFNNLNLDPTRVEKVVTSPNFGTVNAALAGRTVELQGRFSF